MTHASESGENLRRAAKNVGLPPRPFLYTIDQISVLLSLSEADIRARYIYFQGRSIGAKSPDLMTARNIAPRTDSPEWRVTETELIRWMRSRGFRYYERSTTRS
jgi:hypothetical protein